MVRSFSTLTHLHILPPQGSLANQGRTSVFAAQGGWGKGISGQLCANLTFFLKKINRQTWGRGGRGDPISWWQESGKAQFLPCPHWSHPAPDTCETLTAASSEHLQTVVRQG